MTKEEASIGEVLGISIIALIAVLTVVILYLREIKRGSEQALLINLVFFSILILISIVYASNYILKKFNKIEQDGVHLRERHDELNSEISKLRRKVEAVRAKDGLE